MASSFTYHIQIVQNHGHRKAGMDHRHVVCVLGCFRVLSAFGAVEKALRPGNLCSKPEKNADVIGVIL
jgi:hypothetical protein